MNRHLCKVNFYYLFISKMKSRTRKYSFSRKPITKRKSGGKSTIKRYRKNKWRKKRTSRKIVRSPFGKKVREYLSWLKYK